MKSLAIFAINKIIGQILTRQFLSTHKKNIILIHVHKEYNSEFMQTLRRLKDGLVESLERLAEILKCRITINERCRTIAAIDLLWMTGGQ